jgi:hypothetical protein
LHLSLHDSGTGIDKTLALTYIRNYAYPDQLIEVASRNFTLEINMTLDRAVFAFAGSFILISLALAHWVSPWWLLFTAFVGANMLQTAFTGFCPLVIILKKLGVKPGQAFN